NSDVSRPCGTSNSRGTNSATRPIVERRLLLDPEDCTREREEGSGQGAQAAHDRASAGEYAAQVAGGGAKGRAPRRDGRPRARGPQPAAAVRDRQGARDPGPLEDGQVGPDRGDPPGPLDGRAQYAAARFA